MGLLTQLGRQFALLRHKPGHWRLRPGTIDRRIFRWVAIENEYRLPRRFGPGDVILDVGAHIGSFAHAVLKRGAGAVHCYEADADNFRLLQHNLTPHAGRARLCHCAVWRSDGGPTHLRFGNPGDGRNTGACMVTETGGQTVPVRPFDDLVAEATGRGARRVRLLKLDCEGAEWPILLTARALGLVDAVCGEYHLGDFPAAFAVSGHGRFTPDLLDRHLTAQGFRVRTQPVAKEPDRFGLFFAER